MPSPNCGSFPREERRRAVYAVLRLLRHPAKIQRDNDHLRGGGGVACGSGREKSVRALTYFSMQSFFARSERSAIIESKQAKQGGRNFRFGHSVVVV